MTAQMNVANAVIAIAIMGGILLSVVVAAVTLYMLEREKRDRSILPWGPRKKVEKARAAAEAMELETRREAADIMRLTLEPKRRQVLTAIENGEPLPADLPALNAASPNGNAMREAAWGASS